MNKKQVIQQIESRGYKTTSNILDFRNQDCTNWFWTSGEPLLSIEKEGHRLEIICVGDIRIHTKHKRFIFKGGNPDGELTPYLKKHGDWENNNWFEINENNSSYNDFEEVFYDINSATESLLSRLK